MAGYLDRPNLDIQVVRDFLKAECAKHQPGSIMCMGYLNALEKLDELHRFKRDFHPALVRNDELIREARAELAVENVNHYATKVLLERAERLIVEHRMRQEGVGDNGGRGAVDHLGSQGVRHGELVQQQGSHGCSSHPSSACCHRAPEEGEQPRVQARGV